MSDKPKFYREDALKVAAQIQELLIPVCQRIAIVGSIRRGKQMVSDAELLFVPKTVEVKADFFDTKMVSAAEAVCQRMLNDGILKKRPNVNGHFCWGESNKLCLHVKTGIPIDLFSVRSECWWVSLVIRTGSKETNLRLTKGAIALGANLNAYGEGITRRDGTVIPATCEEDVFRLCGVKYLPPKER